MIALVVPAGLRLVLFFFFPPSPPSLLVLPVEVSAKALTVPGVLVVLRILCCLKCLSWVEHFAVVFLTEICIAVVVKHTAFITLLVNSKSL